METHNSKHNTLEFRTPEVVKLGLVCSPRYEAPACLQSCCSAMSDFLPKKMVQMTVLIPVIISTFHQQERRRVVGYRPFFKEHLGVPHI